MQLAVACYERGLSIQPKKDPAMYHNLIGVAYHEMHRSVDAQAHYEVQHCGLVNGRLMH